MLRVYFTSDDISRVRVAATPDFLWEITNSFQVLGRTDSILNFGAWRRQVRSHLSPTSRVLAAVLPPRGYSPDFLTPDLRGARGLEAAVDTVLSTPRSRLRSDVARLVAGRPGKPPTGIRALAEGEPATLDLLGSALRSYHRDALAPYWPDIEAHVDADRAVRARAVLDGGVDGLLAGFRPVLRWHPPVLEADYPVDRELHLGGRGILLQPSFFCLRTPVTLADGELTPVLVYPIQHTPGWPPPAARAADSGARDALGALLGRTRAAILEAVVHGRTTGELAGRFGISGPAVSQHTTVLREAGLLLSIRRGKSVLHSVTPAGIALLDTTLFKRQLPCVVPPGR